MKSKFSDHYMVAISENQADQSTHSTRSFSKNVRAHKYNINLLKEDLAILDGLSESEYCKWKRSEFLEIAIQDILLQYLRNLPEPLPLHIAQHIDKQINTDYQFDLPWSYKVMEDEFNNRINQAVDSITSEQIQQAASLRFKGGVSTHLAFATLAGPVGWAIAGGSLLMKVWEKYKENELVIVGIRPTQPSLALIRFITQIETASNFNKVLCIRLSEYIKDRCDEFSQHDRLLYVDGINNALEILYKDNPKYPFRKLGRGSSALDLLVKEEKIKINSK